MSIIGKMGWFRASDHLDNNCGDTGTMLGILCYGDVQNSWASHTGVSVPFKENDLITP